MWKEVLKTYRCLVSAKNNLPGARIEDLLGAKMNEFVLVSPMGQAVAWAYVTPESLRVRYKNDAMRLPEVEEFIENSKPGHFIALDEAHLLFRVTQCS